MCADIHDGQEQKRSIQEPDTARPTISRSSYPACNARPVHTKVPLLKDKRFGSITRACGSGTCPLGIVLGPASCAVTEECGAENKLPNRRIIKNGVFDRPDKPGESAIFYDQLIDRRALRENLVAGAGVILQILDNLVDFVLLPDSASANNDRFRQRGRWPKPIEGHPT